MYASRTYQAFDIGWNRREARQGSIVYTACTSII